MSVSCSMDTTPIFDIEVSTLFSRGLHELARRCIDDIIHSTAESITPLTHGQGRLGMHEGDGVRKVGTLIYERVL